jgi:hypothetical protein
MMRVSIGQLLIAAFVALSLAAVIGGFLTIGSPAKQRLLALDEKRSGNLVGIASSIRSHWEENGRLPAQLSDLSTAWSRNLTDPDSGEPYRYEVTGEKTYKLCAVFALKDDEPGDAPWERQFSTHEAGLHCFDLNVESSRTLGDIPILKP